jgi:hypothetical protein
MKQDSPGKPDILEAAGREWLRVVFLDELPWLASPRSSFLSALDPIHWRWAASSAAAPFES